MRIFIIIVFATIVVFAAVINAPAMDFGIDKAVSLNVRFLNDKELVSELKVDNLDLEGSFVSGNLILKARLLKDNGGMAGKLYSNDITLNSKPLPELNVFFKLTKDKIRIYSMNFGKSYSLKGTVGLKEPFETNLYFEILRANLRDLAIVTNARHPDVVAGIMNGLLNIKGPIKNLESIGFISGKSGKIGPIWYDTADVRIHGVGPIINIVESRIRQNQATFTMEGYLDLRNIANSNPIEGIKIKSDMRMIVWDGWDISKDGSDSLKMVKDIGDRVSVGFKTVARKDLSPFQKKENMDEMSLEYKLDETGQAFQMKLKENEEFFGIEHKKRF
ncbi:MAG: hypothetical protein Q8N76_03055 [Candidatus Omnitrophota bacterium]|nr:hypothetical protein [Candidatus Omnitrophota bacterium]